MCEQGSQTAEKRDRALRVSTAAGEERRGHSDGVIPINELALAGKRVNGRVGVAGRWENKDQALGVGVGEYRSWRRKERAYRWGNPTNELPLAGKRANGPMGVAGRREKRDRALGMGMGEYRGW